jgi:hypothetical protein
MFLFNSTGTLLPYIISLVALWSGLVLGYGQIFNFKSSPVPEHEIKAEQKPESVAPLATHFFTGKSTIHKISFSHLDLISENNQPKIHCWLWFLNEFRKTQNISEKLPGFDISPTRGPPVC